MIEPISLSFFAAGAIYHVTQRIQARSGRPDRLRRSKWTLPPLHLLDTPSDRLQGDLGGNGGKLVEELRAMGLPVTLDRTVHGPTVVRYELKLGGAKVSRFLAAKLDMAVAVGTSDVRLLAPVSGREGVVGVEVPRSNRELVRLRSVTEDRLGVLDVVVGLTTDGESVIANIAELPHLLVAGATGAGKSTMLNALLVSLLMGASPNDLRLVLIDPKRVEMAPYAKLPHLWVPVVKDAAKAIDALRDVVELMEQRYVELEKLKVRNIPEARAKGTNMPYLVVIIDELADLMMVTDDDVEELIIRLAQKGRAAGINMVLATQRPSVDVVTGLIKANVPAKAAFAVTSATDSRVIGLSGAQNLTGEGDMLFDDGKRAVTRVQGAFVSDDEIEEVVRWWTKRK